MAGMPESDLAERSTVILGFRFFALAAVVGTASLLPADRVSVPLVVIGVLLASGTAALQHFARTRLSHEAAKWFIWPQVGVWTLLIHATGGPGSPLALGYLFELPLSGALLGRRGVVIVALASIAIYLSYAVSLGSFEARTAAILLAMIVLCATITWWVVGILERQRSRIERSRAWLADRADTLAAELRNLGESLEAGLVSIDDRGRIASLNPSSAALLDVEPRHALGKPWQEVLGLDPASRLRLAETVESGVPHRGVTMILSHRSGASATVRADIWRGVGQDGQGVHLLLDPARSSIPDDPVRQLGESAACVAHQIKNSMHSIQGFLGELAPADGRAGHPTQECLGALRGLGALAEDVLAMAGTARPEPERVAIQDVLRSAIVLLGQPPIRMALPDSPLYVEVHRSQLVHAVFNLLDNAVRVNPPGDVVRVSVERHDDRVIVDIADAGPGIAPDVPQASGQVHSRHGSGWGLTAAHRFVKACDGQLSVAAGEHGGTRCRLELPAAPNMSFERSVTP